MQVETGNFYSQYQTNWPLNPESLSQIAVKRDFIKRCVWKCKKDKSKNSIP